jgi:hypothetical protein
MGRRSAAAIRIAKAFRRYAPVFRLATLSGALWMPWPYRQYDPDSGTVLPLVKPTISQTDPLPMPWDGCVGDVSEQVLVLCPG